MSEKPNCDGNPPLTRRDKPPFCGDFGFWIEVGGAKVWKNLFIMPWLSGFASRFDPFRVLYSRVTFLCWNIGCQVNVEVKEILEKRLERFSVCPSVRFLKLGLFKFFSMINFARLEK